MNFSTGRLPSTSTVLPVCAPPGSSTIEKAEPKAHPRNSKPALAECLGGFCCFGGCGPNLPSHPPCPPRGFAPRALGRFCLADRGPRVRPAGRSVGGDRLRRRPSLGEQLT